MTVSRTGSLSSHHLQVTLKPIEALRLDPKNPRRHEPAQVKKIARSIEQFGFNVPILIDAEQCVIAGHARLLAGKLLGLSDVPTIRLEHLSPEKRRAFMIADNRLTEIATWDDELLAQSLKELSVLELDFDLETIGFETAEIDLRIADATENDEPDIPVPPVEIDRPPTARAGDVWLLGQHKIFCGSALEPASYKTLLGDEKAAVVFTDPPYNVPIGGHATGLGETQHREFAMASGEMSAAEFTTFLRSACEQMAVFSMSGSLHFICMDWRHLDEISAAGRAVYNELKNLCVWVKTNAGMGSLYRSQHELVFVFKHGSARHHNNVQLGRFGRHRSNVWQYPGATTFARGAEEGSLLAEHPTIKPTAMIADAVMDASGRGDIVLDPFLGSGTTILAAERTGRRGYGIELDPHYVDLAIRRWQTYTRDHARHALTGETFEATEVKHVG